VRLLVQKPSGFAEVVFFLANQETVRPQDHKTPLTLESDVETHKIVATEKVEPMSSEFSQVLYVLSYMIVFSKSRVFFVYRGFLPR
jgi:hypothetical protein